MITLLLNENRYENDIRSLLMAFFHGEKIVLNPKEEIEAVHCLQVSYEGMDAPQGTITASFDGGSPVTGTCDFSDYKPTRNILKKLVYDLLTGNTGKLLPWGTLTGIRPTKLCMTCFEEGKTREEAAVYLEKTYEASHAKASLCAQVADNERKILAPVAYGQGYSLYVGIPFCPTICAYCSFSSYPLSQWEHRVEDYLAALFQEIDVTAEVLKGQAITSFYMGGGTPTSLTADQMDRLLTKLEDKFHISQALERTVEAGRPDSITLEKLQVIYNHGVERISINPQTMKQETLDLIGRHHRVEDTCAAYELARKVGFENINMDIIVGLPGESIEDVAHTLDMIQELQPESLTVHALAIKRAARFNQDGSRPQSKTSEEVNEMIELTRQRAAELGAEPYYLYRQKNIAGNLENIGYAREGCACLYNILIMEEKQSIIALGAGGTTKIVIPKENRIERSENVKSVKDYIERIEETKEKKKNLHKIAEKV